MQSNKNKYPIIKNNRDQFMTCFIEQSIDDVIKLFIEYNELPDQLDTEISLSSYGGYSFITDSTFKPDPFEKIQIKLSDLVISKLFWYCIYHSDIDFMRHILCIADTKNVFEYLHDNSADHLICDITVDIFKLIITRMKLSQTILDDICFSIIDHDKAELLIVLLDQEHQPKISDIQYAISSCAMNATKILLESNCLVQSALNEFDFYNPKGNNPYWYMHEDDQTTTNLDMIKLLSEYNIKININDLLQYAVQSNQLDLVMFCLESDSKINVNLNLNLAIRVGCATNNLDIMVYLLQYGADINAIGGDDFQYIGVSMIKFLIEREFIFTKEDMFKVFHEVLFSECTISNITYMLDNGANFDQIFMLELIPTERSWFEYIVRCNKMDVIEFLAGSYRNYLLPELNRLFTVSVACGNVPMAEYLLSLGQILIFVLINHLYWHVGLVIWIWLRTSWVKI